MADCYYIFDKSSLVNRSTKRSWDNIFLIFILALILFNTPFLGAVTIGSDSAVNLFTTQQMLESPDRVAGFAWLKNGFSLLGLNTTVTFDSFFPVSGQIALNAGNLVLTRDLNLSNNSDFYTLGNIYGNGHTLELSPSMTAFPSIPIITGVSGVTTGTTTNIGVQVVCTTWSYDSQFLTVCVANNGGSELYLYRYDGATLTFLDSINIGNHAIDVDWHPSQYSFTLGCAATPQIRTFFVNPSVPNLSNVISTFALSNAGAWAQAVAYQPAGNFVAVGTTDNTEQILVFPVNGDGTLDTGAVATVGFGNSLSINSEAINWNKTSEYFAVGVTDSGGTFNELRVYKVTPGPTVTLNASALLGDVPCVDWLKTSTYVIFMGSNISPRLRAFAHNGAAGTVQFIAGESSINALVRCLSPDPSASSVAISTNLDAGGPEFRIYAYDPTSTPSFSLVDSRESTANVDALHWAENANFISYGNATGTVTILDRSSIAFLDQCFTFSNLALYLNSDIAIQNGCITFSGRSLINGRGHTLTLMPTATIIVDSNCQLKIEDITITGLQGTNFNPLDNTGSFLLENTTLVLSDDYIFNTGSFIALGQCAIQGYPGVSFKYLTNQVSTVSVNSQLLIDYGVSFSYAPVSFVNNLLRLVDTSSVLMLSSSLLYTSSAGLALTKGLMKVDGKSFITNDGPTSAQGVAFGDGISVVNNCTLEILPSSLLTLLKGFIAHKNK